MRRLLAVVIALLALVTTFDVAMPEPVEAQSNPPIPRVRIDKECIAPVGASKMRVRGSGFTPGTRVEIWLRTPALAGAGPAIAAIGPVGAGPGVQPAPLPTQVVGLFLGRARVDELGTFDRNVTIDFGAPSTYSTSVVSNEGWYRLSAETEGGGKQGHEDFEAANYCRPTATADTGCNAAMDGKKPMELQISGKGFITKSVELSIEGPSGSMHQDTVAVDGKGQVRTTVNIRNYPAGEYFVRLHGEFTASTWFRTPCPELDVRVLPDCARSGSPPARMDVRVVATGFHEDQRVWVIWDGPQSHEFWNPRTDDDGRLVLTISPYRRGPGNYSLRIRSDDGESMIRQRSVSFKFPCEPTNVAVKQRCARPALKGDGARRLALDVSGTGFEPGNLSVTFDAEGTVEAETFRAKADAKGEFSTRIRPAARPLGSYRIVASQRQTGLSTDGVSVPAAVLEASTSFDVPCRDREAQPLTVAPVCGPEAPGEKQAYEIAVGGSGYYPNGRVFIRFGDTDQFSVQADRDGAFSTVIRPSGQSANGREERRVPVRAQQLDTLGVVVAGSLGRFNVPCPIDPSITIEPGHGPAGYTTLVTGNDFRPGTVVTLTWDRGIEAGRPKMVEVDEDGSFELYVFILPNDWPGERTLAAALVDDPAAFDDVAGTYLVTLGPGVPPGMTRDGIVSRR